MFRILFSDKADTNILKPANYEVKGSCESNPE
jgi:hypothetical protein